MSRRLGQHARLRPDRMEEYKRLHAEVWPGVLSAIKACGLENYSIYLKGDELFAYFEYTGTDFEADMLRMAQDPATQRWWTHTHPCFLQADEQEFYTDMEELFHLD